MGNSFDVVVIGGGFYGCMIARYLRTFNNRVAVVEKEYDILTRASYNNQARVHNGYHYPRSFLTAYRSHANYRRFIKDFSYALEDVEMVYAIARTVSKITAEQFVKFTEQIGSSLQEVPRSINSLFNHTFIERAFIVDEKVFNARKIREQFKNEFILSRIEVMLGKEAVSMKHSQGTVEIVLLDGSVLRAREVFVCAYSSINKLLSRSNVPRLPLKHEWTEMPLVQVPHALLHMGITIMDGPFFGIVPFPDRGLHTLHHVRYTPFQTFYSEKHAAKPDEQSQFSFMAHDAARYIPCLNDMVYQESLYEVRTVLTQNESDDGRPILFRENYGMDGVHIVMGGKIDNIYDVLSRITSVFETENYGRNVYQTK